jgi:adenylate kinase family enzyme
VASQVVTQLPPDARRVVVRGASGSGKTTTARKVAAALDVEHVELDGVFHQAGWTPLPDDEFLARVDAVVAGDAWVLCGNYHVVADHVLDRADTVVLYDLPRRTVMARMLRRSLWRVVRREELWNGNREQWRNLLRTDPQRSIVAWAWTTHGRYHEFVRGFLAAPPRRDLRLVHLASRTDERTFLSGLPAAAAARAG